MKEERAHTARSAEWIVEMFLQQGQPDAAENVRHLIEERILASSCTSRYAVQRFVPQLAPALAMSCAVAFFA